MPWLRGRRQVLKTSALLDDLEHGDFNVQHTPWGIMRSIGAREANITVKHIVAAFGTRTSLQLHERKDELLIIMEDFGSGFITVAGGDVIRGRGTCVRVRPGVEHRVTGPMHYLEISTYDAGDDTVRLEDDYGRVTS